jgi:signal transduction histidine kinase
MPDSRQLEDRPPEITTLESRVRALEAALSQEREARRRAEEANRRKDDFLSILSHDLRSPLNAAVTWIQVLRNEDADIRTREQALSSLERIAGLQARMMEDLLDISRILSGKLSLDLQDVDFARIVRASVDQHLESAEEKGVRLETAFESSGVPMRGDGARLLQLVNSVVSNALKFTPQGRGVAVSLRRLDGAVEVKVADQGEGIPPERLSWIFDRFRPGEGVGGRRGGLGLGLTIARHLATLHGGTIEAESAGAGQGSTFLIRLRLEPPGNDLPSATRGPA